MQGDQGNDHNISQSLPTREVGISTVSSTRDSLSAHSHFPHGKWGFQPGVGRHAVRKGGSHFPHGKWGFQLLFDLNHSLHTDVTSHTGSGDFNATKTASRPTRGVTSHTGSGDFNRTSLRTAGLRGSHFPHGKWGFQRPGRTRTPAVPGHFPCGKRGFQRPPYMVRL